MKTRGIRAFLLAAGVLAAWAAPAHAQAIGSIFGKVTDVSGGVLPWCDRHGQWTVSPGAAGGDHFG